MKHEGYSAAPWKAVDLRHQKNGQIRIFGNRTSYIANVLARVPEVKANARLIEDAPRLAAREEEAIELAEMVIKAFDPGYACELQEHEQQLLQKARAFKENQNA